MNKIKVSILVPVYNTSQFIHRCAVSLFEQTYENIEYVFVNDCTPDDSIEVLTAVINSYPSRIKNVKIISHKINQGLAIARNTAISHATGEYVCHVDSDDFIPSSAIEALVNNAVRTNADIVYGNCICLKEQHEHLFKQVSTSSITKYMKSILTRRSMVNIWGKLIKRDLYTPDILLMKEDSFGEDYLTLPKLITKSEIVSHEKSVVYFYTEIRSGSYCHNFNREKMKRIKECEEKLAIWFKNQNIRQYDKYLRLGSFYNKAGIIEHSLPKDYHYIHSLYPGTVPFSFFFRIKVKHLFILLLYDFRLFKVLQYATRLKNK